MSTIPYAPPSVGPAGLTVSAYPSILSDNLSAYLNIFGQTQYIGPDSAIYQFISVLSLKNSDTNLALQLDYNQTSPKTAVGTGLDRLLILNGLAREAVTFSEAELTIRGTAGAVLNNCFAQDQNGNLWAIPSGTVIGFGGVVTAEAVCTTPGDVNAVPGSINIVATPVTGWTPPSGSVTNTAAAIAGLPVESDSKARARQAISVALPSTTPLAGTVAALLATVGVTRIAPGYPTPGGPGNSIENPTGGTDSWGNPAHSISMVVEGGADLDIANAIYRKKTIGCFTNGTTTVSVTDPNTGFIEGISFFRPTYIPIYVTATVHGYTSTPNSATLLAISTAVTNYLNALAIGETVSIAAVNYEIMALNQTLNAPAFGVQSLAIGVAASPTGTVDVPMPNYFDVAEGVLANVLVTTV